MFLGIGVADGSEWKHGNVQDVINVLQSPHATASGELGLVGWLALLGTTFCQDHLIDYFILHLLVGCFPSSLVTSIQTTPFPAFGVVDRWNERDDEDVEEVEGGISREIHGELNSYGDWC